MRILYGVVGEGLGHAMRSQVILDHLLSEDHEVEVMASGRAVDYLSQRFGSVNRIHGLHMIYEENRVRRGKTLASNISEATTGVPRNIAAYFDLITKFQPEAVISDFESWTYLFAKTHGLPVLSVDNMQIINRASLPDEVIEGYEAEFELTKAFIKSKLPFCSEYFITTFFRPTLRKDRTSLFPPILRPEILDAEREDGEHILVYTTGEGNTAFASALAKTGIECRIYGMRRSITEEEREGNLRYMPFGKPGFIEDLATARAVIGGGGFTLMGEAVYLHKPMLAVPLGYQFEQVLNARYLELEGFGRFAPTLEDPATVFEFVEAIPGYREKLSSYSQDGNKEIFGGIDEWLDKAAAGLA